MEKRRGSRYGRGMVSRLLGLMIKSDLVFPFQISDGIITETARALAIGGSDRSGLRRLGVLGSSSGRYRVVAVGSSDMSSSLLIAI
ncbi:unnamed protein product [Brassica oleracea var. botrytis]|uniref:(rape) hypothetical protein n=1 Tax=Brassica napus TaxID=3708 RepID=A0A816JPB8_BRANA|nr:unnamed protein product [Brassica napus]